MQQTQTKTRLRLSLALPVAPEAPPQPALDPERDDDAIKAQTWPVAYERWLAGGWHSHGAAVSEQTRRAYRRSVEGFRDFIGDSYPVWRVTASQVAGWQNEMRSRGLAAATINLRLAGLSSLFDFLAGEGWMSINPVGAAPRAPVPYRKPRGLTRDETQAILRHINRSIVSGLQDYALVITVLDAGWSSKRVTQLKWGELQSDELSLSTRSAIRAYVQAAGRLETIGADDYIFVALSDVAGRLPNVKRLDHTKPLSGAMINRIVKKCARRAGLDESRVRVNTLRLTADERDAERDPLWKNVGAFLSMV